MGEYIQNYNPTGSVFLSTFLAALPLLLFLYLLAVHPHKTKDGRKEYGIYAPYAAMISALAVFIIVIAVMKMEPVMAISAFIYGAAKGLFPIGWIIFAAIFLYNTTVISGKFAVLKDSLSGITSDPRLQVLLIGFSFVCFMEGAAGFGTPVAVCGSILVGMGFNPMTAALVCLIGNVAPALGALGVPTFTLSDVSGLPIFQLTQQSGLQFIFMPVLVAFWVVGAYIFREKGKWSDLWAVSPAILVSGGTFAVVQLFTAMKGWYMIIGMLAGIVSILCTMVFLKIWKPKKGFGQQKAVAPTAHPAKDIVMAWLPWILLGISVTLLSIQSIKTSLNSIFIWKYTVPNLDGLSLVQPPIGDGSLHAVFTWDILTMGGTGIMAAAIVSGLLVLRLSGQQWVKSFSVTAKKMKSTLLVLCFVLGFSTLTRFAGTDAILGLAFTKTGAAYPFFAPMLGWLGVFISGSDTAANSMFGNLQKITAQQLNLNPLPITAATTTGGIIGKIINAQSVVVATAACYEDQKEGMASVGPIIRAGIPHSVALILIYSTWLWFQYYFLPSMMIPMP
ncbi:L-lactate transport [Syntrophobotulus glycolicus DSM 8271]|uniref:L-lactate permease n=1 Tax=Syntrophobotulus glycolicus (strain DSM 8271 / FlGlyR) TaxID=645991 RepID=F0T0C2_SYNGF|nr:L-lactate permease [Syntrophobotulus glycolicus]ADY57294.1 L-lactate transport [Syntrophobotulus glycolicus DSM 8271]